MKGSLRIGQAFGVLLLCFSMASALAMDSSSKTEVGADAGLSWNLQKNEAPFIQLAGARADVAGPLSYPSGEFALPLSQTLIFDSTCDCYSLMLRSATNDLELLNLWRTRAGFYRSSRPYLELTNLDSLKAVTTLSGTRFLFAQVGDGNWRCVSIHDPLGNYLLIDYRADGLIERIRDSFARTATPIYSQGRMISLLQSWNAAGNPQSQATVVR